MWQPGLKTSIKCFLIAILTNVVLACLKKLLFGMFQRYLLSEEQAYEVV